MYLRYFRITELFHLYNLLDKLFNHCIVIIMILFFGLLLAIELLHIWLNGFMQFLIFRTILEAKRYFILSKICT